MFTSSLHYVSKVCIINLDSSVYDVYEHVLKPWYDTNCQLEYHLSLIWTTFITAVKVSIKSYKFSYCNTVWVINRIYYDVIYIESLIWLHNYFDYIFVIGCPPTHYGHLCNTTCPQNCKGPCDLDVGICKFGCINGWTGNRCENGKT